MIDARNKLLEMFMGSSDSVVSPPEISIQFGLDAGPTD